MEAYDVDAAVQAVEQAPQFAYMRRRVVEPLHEDILERQPPLSREVVPPQHIRKLAYGICLLDGHDLGALVVEGVVQAYGYMYLRRLDELLQTRRYARRG